MASFVFVIWTIEDYIISEIATIFKWFIFLKHDMLFRLSDMISVVSCHLSSTTFDARLLSSRFACWVYHPGCNQQETKQELKQKQYVCSSKSAHRCHRLGAVAQQFHQETRHHFFPLCLPQHVFLTSCLSLHSCKMAASVSGFILSPVFWGQKGKGWESTSLRMHDSLSSKQNYSQKTCQQVSPYIALIRIG